MSLLGFLRKPPCLPAASIAVRSMSVCITSRLRASHEDGTHNRTCRGDVGGRAAVAGEATVSSIEDFFIGSLVAAATCREHREAAKSDAIAWKRANLRRTSDTTNARAQQLRHFSCRSRCQSAVAAVAGPPNRPDISHDEYKELVNTYPGSSVHPISEHPISEQQLAERAKERERAKQYFPLASRLVLTAEQEITKGFEHREPSPPQDEDHARQLDAFAILLARRDWGTIPHDELWKLYDDLRPPRVRYLSDSTVKKMFRHLSWKEYRPSQESMHRYLDLISEAIGERIRLSSGIWNTAIFDAGTWVRNATSAQVKAAIELWRRMEDSGTRADHVTLNILFLVAVKANRYALANTIFKELVARGLPLNRYFRASVIYYAGRRRDGEGVRRAFRDLVNAGEIVDTTIMNSVILGLVRSGEAPAAENVFFRMKNLHEEKCGTLLPEDWRTRKELARVLNKTGSHLRKEQQQHEASFFGAAFSSDDKREQVQQVTPIAPDSTTYRILIKYHAYVSGNINKIRDLLAEMQGRGLHVHGSVYVHLLRGFHIHGGWPRSQWSPTSLEELWKEILTSFAPPPPTAVEVEQHRPESVEEDCSDMLGAMPAEQASSSAKYKPFATHSPSVEAPQSELERRTYFTKTMVMAAIHAYHQCATPRRMLEIWDEIRERWHDASSEDYAAVRARVDRLATAAHRRR